MLSLCDPFSATVEGGGLDYDEIGNAPAGAGPVSALETEAVTTGVREIVGRRPKFYKRFQEDKTLRLPGF